MSLILYNPLKSDSIFIASLGDYDRQAPFGISLILVIKSWL